MGDAVRMECEKEAKQSPVLRNHFDINFVYFAT